MCGTGKEQEVEGSGLARGGNSTTVLNTGLMNKQVKYQYSDPVTF